MADTSRDSTYRAKKSEGLKDVKKINPLYNTSAIIKMVADKFNAATSPKGK